MEEEYWPSEESESDNEEIPQHNIFNAPPIQHFLLFCGNSYITSQILQ